MIAAHTDATELTVATIAAIATVVASLIASYFAYKAARRVRTSNGHDAGELLEFIAEEVSWLRINFVEHAKDQEIHRVEARTHSKKAKGDE